MVSAESPVHATSQGAPASRDADVREHEVGTRPRSGHRASHCLDRRPDRQRDSINEVTGPARTRVDVRRVGLLVMGLIVVTVGLWAVGIVVRDSSSINGFDRHVTTFVVEHRSPGLNQAMRIATWFGSWVVIVIGFLIIAGLVFTHRLPPATLAFAAVVVGGGEIAVQLVKELVQRPRPPPEIALVSARGWSFPSGHTATAFAVYMVVAVLVTHATHRRALACLARVAALAIGTLVAFSRLELAAHWTTDVISSALAVSAWLAVVYAIACRTGPAAPTPPGP
jgi:undecaprenyl-diphosphatase